MKKQILLIAAGLMIFSGCGDEDNTQGAQYGVLRQNITYQGTSITNANLAPVFTKAQVNESYVMSTQYQQWHNNTSSYQTIQLGASAQLSWNIGGGFNSGYVPDYNNTSLYSQTSNAIGRTHIELYRHKTTNNQYVVGGTLVLTQDFICSNARLPAGTYTLNTLEVGHTYSSHGIIIGLVVQLIGHGKKYVTSMGSLRFSSFANNTLNPEIANWTFMDQSTRQTCTYSSMVVSEPISTYNNYNI